MTRKMIVNAMDPEEVRIAILNGPTLEDFDIEARGSEKNKGNIYRGIVMAVEPALNAAFVNYGADKQGFLTAYDVNPKYAQTPPPNDRHPGIHHLLKPGQTVLVQITKDEVGSKGAVLTTYLSLAGSYLVLMPDSQAQGISRKIDDEETRTKVREAADKLDVPDSMGVIIRTAGKDRTKLDLNRDLRVLLRLWENIQKEASTKKAPSLIYKEQDIIIRALRDYFSPDIDEIVLDSDEAYDRAAEYMHMVMPSHRSALSRYVERRPIFHHYRIEQQLDIIYSRRVTLPSGGSIVIDPTEALVAIDVNSGKQKSSNQEDTALQTNLEAAREVGRQLRLRDLGGIVVIDFIDMGQKKNKERVEKAMKAALVSDKARVKPGHISRNGLLEITRQRLRSSLEQTVFDICNVCLGTGHVLSSGSQAIASLRKLRDRASRGDLRAAKIRLPPTVANELRTTHWASVQEVEKRYSIRVDINPEHSLRAGQDDFTFDTDPHAAVLPIEEPNFGPAPQPEGVDAAYLAALDASDPLADTDDDDLDGEAADDGSQDEQEKRSMRPSDDLARDSRRRRGRGRGGAAVGSRRLNGRVAEADEDPFAFPEYEFIDPALLQLAADRPTTAAEAGPARGRRRTEDEETTGRPSRRRRGRRGRPESGTLDSPRAANAGGRSAAAKEASGQSGRASSGIGGFFRRLFGMTP